MIDTIYDRLDIRQLSHWLPRKVAIGFNRFDLMEDLRQDFWMFAGQLDPHISLALARIKIYHDLIDRMRARVYFFSYEGRVPVAICADIDAVGSRASEPTQEPMVIARSILTRGTEEEREMAICVWVHGNSMSSVGRQMGCSHTYIRKRLNGFRDYILEEERKSR